VIRWLDDGGRNLHYAIRALRRTSRGGGAETIHT
jgi:hypothetical protein